MRKDIYEIDTTHHSKQIWQRAKTWTRNDRTSERHGNPTQPGQVKSSEEESTEGAKGAKGGMFCCSVCETGKYVECEDSVSQLVAQSKVNEWMTGGRYVLIKRGGVGVGRVHWWDP